jgi:hypothetical protein
MSRCQKEVIDRPIDFSYVYAVNRKRGSQLPDTVERKSRLVSLAYQVLGTMDLPPLDASEGEVLAALASAFHRKALVAVETGAQPPRGKPALPKNNASAFETQMRWSNPPH